MKSSLILYQGSGFTKQEPKVFVKDVLRVGRWKHPVTGQDVEITKERIRKIALATEQYRQTLDRKAIPFPDGHTFDAKANLGWWTRFMVHDDRLVGVVEVTDDEAARKIENSSIRSVSARIDPKVKDTQGREYGEVMTHICATPVPVLDGQQDFLKLSREAGESADLFIPKEIPGISPEGKETRMLKALALALGLTEDAKEDQLVAAAKAALDGRKAAEDKAKGYEGLSAVKPEDLKAHGLEVKDGALVKLAAPPPADETPREKELRAKLEKVEREQALSRLANVKREVEEFSKAGHVPPALVPAFTELLSLQQEAQALTLSADGSAVQKGINVVARVQEIMKGLPKITDLQLSQNAGKDAEAKNAEKAADESLARVVPGLKKEAAK